MRRFAIGDIHGCSKALHTLIECIDPQPDDDLIFLGDYVDRGPDSRGVIDLILSLQDQCNVIALKGNHEIMLCGVAFGGLDPDIWMQSGGKATVSSYGGSLEKIPASHRSFLQSLKNFHETDGAIFVHASYDPNLSMDQQKDELLFWNHLPPVPSEHQSGKRVYVGHTPQGDGTIMDLGHIVCIDTYCFGTGYLTAMNVGTDELIQVDKKGFRRRVPAEAFFALISSGCKRLKGLLKRSPNVPSQSSSEPARRKQQRPASPSAEPDPSLLQTTAPPSPTESTVTAQAVSSERQESLDG